MQETQPAMTGGCQCGAVRYALFQVPVSSVCHCRMCQKAVGGLFAAYCRLPLNRFAWTRATPASFRSSSVAERHFCASTRMPWIDLLMPGALPDVPPNIPDLVSH
jgi:hypothetical protein